MTYATTTSGPPTSAAPTELADDHADQYVRPFVDRWDELIDWDRRGQSEGQFFVDILRAAGARQVLDVATGTGYHAVRLAEAGFQVTAADASAEMLRRAEHNARARGQVLPFVPADWRDLPATVSGRYDAVLCLGSSFPHLFEPADQVRALESFHAMLRPGGLLLLDHRNFDAIRAARYQSSGQHYYCGSGVRVSVASVDKQRCRFRYAFADGHTYHLEVYPILTTELLDLLGGHGFGGVRTFGDFQPYRPDTDPDFVIHVAQRQ
ncbi:MULTISPECIES: class I SAM-dependent methyltransferase [unclassified Solwaraspora]|uniref:class I SAM-dependent methyltransferase n=1 Tax=unclassified Solwaraspora TaxID=2627926 RepID=UPI00259B56F9|nr:class I SAM-dependent methyltransferase [Solwaraspora sp. WMMA2056]WJK38709.1 class I SAM-dependent methyltransferase [Solwaraspora sp. WMMA2056]